MWLKKVLSPAASYLVYFRVKDCVIITLTLDHTVKWPTPFSVTPVADSGWTHHFTHIILWQAHSPEVTYVGRSTATQPGDRVDEVLLHLSAVTHTSHQLFQQLPVLHLKEGGQHDSNDMEESVVETYTPLTHS